MSSIQPSNDLTIYLRNSQKKAVSVTVPLKPTYEGLRQLACARLSIEEPAARLFFRGELLGEDSKIKLSQKSIIHCINLANTHRESLTITIRLMQSPESRQTFTVVPQDVIKTFADEKLAPYSKKTSDEIFLVYASKQLEMESTFEEQWVEDHSEIMCVNVENSQFQIQSSSLLQPTYNRESPEERQRKDCQKNIRFYPGKGHLDAWGKKPKPKPVGPPGQQQPGPNSDTTIPAAPPNIVIKKNIPKEANPEDLKSGAPPQPREARDSYNSNGQSLSIGQDERKAVRDSSEGENRNPTIPQPPQTSPPADIAQGDVVQSDKSYSEVEEAIGKPIMDAAQEQNPVESDKSFSENEEAVGKPIMDAAEEENPVESDKSFSDNQEAVGKPIMDAAQEENPVESDKSFSETEEAVGKPVMEPAQEEMVDGDPSVGIEQSEPLVVVIPAPESSERQPKAEKKGEVTEHQNQSSDIPEKVPESKAEYKASVEAEDDPGQSKNQHTEGNRQNVKGIVFKEESNVPHNKFADAWDKKQLCQIEIQSKSKEQEEKNEVDSPIASIEHLEDDILKSKVPPEEPSEHLLIDDSKEDNSKVRQEVKQPKNSQSLLIDRSKEEEGTGENVKPEEKSEQLLIENSIETEEPANLHSASRPQEQSSNLLSHEESPQKPQEKEDQRRLQTENKAEKESSSPKTQVLNIEFGSKEEPRVPDVPEAEKRVEEEKQHLQPSTVEKEGQKRVANDEVKQFFYLKEERGPIQSKQKECTLIVQVDNAPQTEESKKEEEGEKKETAIAEIDNFFSKHAKTIEQLGMSGHASANHNASNLSQSFEKVEVPAPGKVEFKAGDLIYSGEMHVNETEHMMRDILAGYAHLLPKEIQKAG